MYALYTLVGLALAAGARGSSRYGVSGIWIRIFGRGGRGCSSRTFGTDLFRVCVCVCEGPLEGVDEEAISGVVASHRVVLR